MDVVQMAAGKFLLVGGSNVGVVVEGDRAVLVDAGLDKDAGRKVRKALDGLGVRPVALLITHGHADHFGGAAWLAQWYALQVYAPPLEGAIAANPLLELLFLFGGAAPVAALRGKFTLGRSAPVSGGLSPGELEVEGISVSIVPLGGHAPEQIGVGCGEVLFCADAFFPREVLEKHGIPFCTDLDAALETLERLPTLGYAWYAPGHGRALRGDEAVQVCALNAERLRTIRAAVFDALDVPREGSAILRVVADRMGAQIRDLVGFALALTTVYASLTSLERQGAVRWWVEENRLLWGRG